MGFGSLDLVGGSVAACYVGREEFEHFACGLPLLVMPISTLEVKTGGAHQGDTVE